MANNYNDSTKRAPISILIKHLCISFYMKRQGVPKITLGVSSDTCKSGTKKDVECRLLVCDSVSVL
jgi:hypothetical protein